jgi:hypothetical protein
MLPQVAGPTSTGPDADPAAPPRPAAETSCQCSNARSKADRHAPCGNSLQDGPLGALVSVGRRRVGPTGYRCTTGQVRVRVTPVMAWIRDTTSWPRLSMLRASARTITSYGPVSG